MYKTSKRVLSLFLSILLMLSLIPVTAFPATAAVSGDFMKSIKQLDIVPDGYIGIYTQYDLENIPRNPSGLYMLMEDIEVSNWIPICQSDNPFTGVLEGNGHTISGIDITTEWEKDEKLYLGLFSNIKDARIANLKVRGQISLTYIRAYGGTSGTSYIGGICAYAKGNIHLDNCVSDVTIYTEGHSMAQYHGYGGVIGGYESNNSTASISYCKNTAEVNGINPNGGIIGYIDSFASTLNIFGCRNENNINGTLYTAGIVGEIESDGVNDQITIAACWNKGTIDTIDQGGGICAEINSSNHMISIEDCLNTGRVSTRNAPSDAGGIVGASYSNYAEISTCINTGPIGGAPSGSAIAGKIRNLDLIQDCYWLDTGKSLVGLLYKPETVLSIRDGALSAEEMKKEENYKNFDFSNIWEMSSELGHPIPNPILNNVYKETYIDDTITFADDSYRYKKIMSGSGRGSLAGIVGDTYEQSQLDFWNGVWDGIEFANAFASANVELKNEYDAILADMIYGSLGKDMTTSHLNDSLLATYSDLTTYVATEFNSIDFVLASSNLKELCRLGNVYDTKTTSIMTKLRNAAVKNITLENLGNAFSTLGSVVSMADIADKGCKELHEMYDFYLLCNAYSDAMKSYCQVFTDIADASYATEDGDEKKADLLQSAISNYINQVEEYMAGDISAIYEKCGKTVEEIAQLGISMTVDLSDFSPVLAGIKDGLNLGVPLANSLTNMKTTAYYGKMLEMTAFLSKGLFDVVQERHDKFAHTQTYEDAEALNLAAEMYINVQILACDYAIGYCNSISSAALSNALKLNYDDIAASIELQIYKANLISLKEHGTQFYIGTDGSINGFLANCPVTVTVAEKNGSVLAKLATGQATVRDGYHAYYPLLGEAKEHKAGLYDSDLHTVTFLGEEDGTMDLVTYGADDGIVTYIYHFNDVPITKGETLTLEGQTLIKENGETIAADSVEKYENPFTDINGHWGKKYILDAYRNKLFSGYTATQFAPDMALTRGMFVTVLARYAGFDASQYKGTAFEDVPEEFYYAPAIKWAAENGIVMGLTETRFGPDEKISRQDMATILYRYAAYAGLKLPEKVSDVSFKDQDKISSYAKAAVQELCKAQIFSGNADNTFQPLNSATRAEAATVFCKLVDAFK